MQAPPPPGISPQQMNLLRVVCSMAWSDGDLAPEEADLMLDHLADMFTTTAAEAADLRHELQDYIVQKVPLEESVPKLKTEEDREFALKLGYMVIRISSRTPDEPSINEEEKEAYRQLIALLGLSPETVQKIEWAAEDELKHHDNALSALEDTLSHFFDRH